MSLPYLAGLFDGEGFFTIRASAPSSINMGKRPLRLQAVVSVTITEKYICDKFAQEFGGYVRVHGKPKKPTHNVYHIWNLTGPKIVEFCNKLMPFLTIKHDRAVLMRDFQLLKSSFGNKSLNDAQYQSSIEMYEKFRELNRRGVQP